MQSAFVGILFRIRVFNLDEHFHSLSDPMNYREQVGGCRLANDRRGTTNRVDTAG